MTTATINADLEALLQRRARLESYLLQDIANQALRQECFEAALQLHDWPRAHALAQDAITHGGDSRAWRLRQAECLLAQRDWPAACTALLELRNEAEDEPALQAAIAHDLAFAALHTGEFESGLAQLADALAPVKPADSLPEATQVLWLRLLHRTGRIDEAVAWARARAQAGTLDVAASGVASLAALDIADYAHALQWSQAALGAGLAQLEALVTRSSLALSEPNPVAAAELAERALQLNATDGRAWSAWAFAALLARRLDEAEAGFQKAVHHMPQHIGTWHGLGWCLVMKGRLAEAEAAFTHACELNSKFAESHGGLAVVQAMQGRAEAAQASIRHALALDRACLSARYAQALQSGDAQDTAEIRRLAVRLLRQQRAPLGSSVLDRLPNLDPP